MWPAQDHAKMLIGRANTATGKRLREDAGASKDSSGPVSAVFGHRLAWAGVRGGECHSVARMGVPGDSGTELLAGMMPMRDAYGLQ